MTTYRHFCKVELAKWLILRFRGTIKLFFMFFSNTQKKPNFRSAFINVWLYDA